MIYLLVDPIFQNLPIISWFSSYLIEGCCQLLSYWIKSSYVCLLCFSLQAQYDRCDQQSNNLFSGKLNRRIGLASIKFVYVFFVRRKEQIGKMGTHLMHIGIPTLCEKHAQQVCCQSKPWEYRWNKLQRIRGKNHSIFLQKIILINNYGSNTNLIKQNVFPLHNR
jgi:hypothetical protein